MFEANTKKLVQKLLCLTLLAFSLFFFSKESTKSLLASSQANQDRSRMPVISVATQDDLPFSIINSFTESFGPEDFRIRLIVQNQSHKRIRAFAIIANNTMSGVQSTRVEFVNLTKSTAILQPTQITEVNLGYSPHDLPETIRLTVDFVEFSDGTTVGPDVHNSRDKLAGMREGGKREKQRLRDLLKGKGPTAVLDSIMSDPASDSEPNGISKPSEEWLQGFRSGVGSIRHRIKQVGQANDRKRVELELTKPFDLAEENQK